MNAVWTLILSNLRTKKLQNGLTALLILLSTLLLATATIVIANTQNLFSGMHARANGSHQVLMLDKGLHDPQPFRQWWAEQPGVTASGLLPYRNLSGLTYRGDEISNIYLFMIDTPELPFTVDKLIPAKGEEAAIDGVPAAGTVWIPTSLSYSYGIEEGDKLGFKTGLSTFELTVSSVVVDIPFGAPFTRNARIWMNPEDYRELIQPLPGRDMYMMGLRFDDYGAQMQLWDRFERQSGTPYLESKMEFESISSFYLIMNKLIGFVMIFLGAVMLLVALFTIGFTISDAILANYRTIGVLKSCGLPSLGIVGTYMAQYALLAVVGIVPGLAASKFASAVLVQSTLSYLRTDRTGLAVQGGLTAALVGLAVLALVVLSVWFYAGKARSVQPVQAIRYGMAEKDESKRSSGTDGGGPIGFDRLPVTLVIGLRNVLKNAKGSVLMGLLTVITSAVLVFGFVLVYSVYSIQRTAPAWGYDNSHIAVDIFNQASFSRDEFEREMLADPRVANIGWFADTTGVIPAEPSMSVYIGVVDGSYDELGYATLRGTNPRERNEIALGVNVSKQLGKDVGDTVAIYINGKKHSLLVTGVYQAIANKSHSARITSEVDGADLTDSASAVLSFINLHDPGQSEQVVKEINAKYKEAVSAVTQQTLIDSVFKEAFALLIAPMGMIGLLFLAVACMILYITCRIAIRKESKTYGIYKSLGLTSRRIRASVTQGIAALAAVGSLLGAVIGVYALPVLLESVLSTYGIVEVPLLIQWGGVAAAASFSVAAAGLGSWLSSKAIAATSPRLLVVE